MYRTKKKLNLKSKSKSHFSIRGCFTPQYFTPKSQAKYKQITKCLHDPVLRKSYKRNQAHNWTYHNEFLRAGGLPYPIQRKFLLLCLGFESKMRTELNGQI